MLSMREDFGKYFEQFFLDSVSLFIGARHFLKTLSFIIQILSIRDIKMPYFHRFFYIEKFQYLIIKEF